VPASALAKTLFPIGHLRKVQVRQMAHAAGLPVCDKPDSTGICFIGERPFQDFLRQHLRTEAGPIETVDGRVIGEHRGLALYTLGQRGGLRVGGRAGARAAPWYVAEKIPARNALIVVQDQDHPLLLSDAFDVEQPHWINPGDAAARTLECTVKTRYRQSDLDCSVRPGAGESWRVTLHRPARAVTPGQCAVFYLGERCLGGGVIARRFNFGHTSALDPAARGIPYNYLFTAEGS
jgi:tRNA-uridine 2-sulfurtransferase